MSDETVDASLLGEMFDRGSMVRWDMDKDGEDGTRHRICGMRCHALGGLYDRMILLLSDVVMRVEESLAIRK